MMKYLEGEEIYRTKKFKQQSVMQRLNVEFYPVLCGSSYKNKGVQLVLMQ